MAHARRHFFELYKAQKSPLAKEGIDRIDVLYDIEKAIRGRSAPERRAARQEYAVPNPASALKCLRITKKDRPVIDPFTI